jgi:energy-converting hydrogenase Eha subunit C
MAIGADESFARNTEAFEMNLVAYTVTGTREINTVLFSNALNKSMVISILKTGLQCIVIDVSY